MISKIVKFTVKPEQKEAFQDALQRNFEGTQSEPGSCGMHLYTDGEHPDTFIAIEHWQDQIAFEAHMTQPYTQAMLAMLPDVLAAPIEIVDLAPLNS